MRAEGLTKRFGLLMAVAGIDFAVGRGESYGFLGPNGAGKSTTMKMIYGAFPRTSGYLEVAGLDVEAHPREVKALIGVAPQETNLDPEYDVHQNLTSYARYFDISRSDARTRADELLAFFQLGEKGGAKILELSGGMKKRLILARALINQPKILILDEPTTGLDPQARRLVWDKLEELKGRGTTILLTTNYMEEAERLCERLVLIDGGRILMEGRPTDLVEKHVGREVLEVPYSAGLVEHLRGLEGAGFEVSGRTVTIVTERAEELLLELHRSFLLHPTIIRRASLEDLFLKMTGRRLGE